MSETSSPSQEKRAIAGRASIVAGGTLASRVLGLVREQALAASFAASVTDAFFVAFLIPNTLRQLLAEGAVQNGVLPVLSKVREEEGEDRARQFFRALRGLSLLISLAVIALGIACAPFLVEVFAGGYQKIPRQFERTVTLTRWVFPYILFMATAALGLAALNTYRRFVVSSYAPALLNVAFIGCVLGLTPWLTSRGIDPIYSLVAGVLLGGVLQALAQWPSLRSIGYHQPPSFRFTDPAVREVLKRMSPVLFGFGIYYLDVIVGRHLLSHEGVGAQSYFGFALRLCDFPQGIFVMAIQSATLPSLASLAARNAASELRETFVLGLRLALFVGIPASALLMVLSEPLVVLLFQRGHFTAESATETAKALLAQGAGVWLVAAIRQLVIVFYALGDTRSPVIVSAIDFVVFVGTALVLRTTLGHVGISWAVSAASLVQLLLLAMFLRRKFNEPILAKREWLGIAKLFVTAAIAAGATLSLRAASAQLGLSNATLGVVGTLWFLAVYLVVAWFARCQEFRMLTEPLLRRLHRRSR
jgi:putative peptidoglycan lipid II flippase